MVNQIHSDGSNGCEFPSLNLDSVALLSPWCYYPGGSAALLIIMKPVRMSNDNLEAIITSFFAPMVPSKRYCVFTSALK